MITTIIFDIGGVLIPERGITIKAIIARQIGVSPQTLDDALTPYKRALTKGEITLKEAYERMQSVLGKAYAPEEIVARHVEAYHHLCTARDSRIIDIIERLKRKYKVVALTNTEQEIAAFNRQRRGEDGKTLYEYFDQAFLSTEMRMKKPDAEIYQAVLREMKCGAENALFIDDKQSYLDGARSVGIQSILYENPEQLQKEMKRLSISF
ncbi:HAD family phosphatase [Candidatus Woesearchaeota archaeon]|nr:HAD family phosphatase [Candidatus Woesearchaeota archaeon]